MTNKRTQKQVIDPSAIANFQFNEKAGAQKQMDVGAKLLPLRIGNTYQTTANAAAVAVGAGRNLAIYNNGTIGSVTVGGVTIATLAPGATDANGKVGIACKPNDWTYVAMGDDTHVITSAATLLVYLIDDDSKIAAQ